MSGDTVTYALPCKDEDIVFGARGRFLILHLKEERCLGVFDVNQSKITG